MNSKNLFYLILSRYAAYIGVFISSVVIIGNPQRILSFSLFFILVLVNSSIRINKLTEKLPWFIGSVLIEIPVIVYMYYRFDSVVFVLLYISVVDVYLILKLKQALLMSIPLSLSIIACFLPIDGHVRLESLIIYTVVNAAIILFFAGASYAVRMELKRRTEIQVLYDELKKSKDELEDANRRLAEYSKKIEDVTVLNERNRLAGEIHDTIGHNLTGLIVEIDICSKLIDRDIDKTKAELMKASSLARNALSEVRKSVRAIKPQDYEGSTGIRALKELIREYEASTQIIVRFNVSKQQYRLSPTVEVTIYRTIQEALTNCAKYGQADVVTVDLDFKENDVILGISDNGVGCREFARGVGLKTMEERIHSLGGSIDFSGNNGFIINVVIPVGAA